MGVGGARVGSGRKIEHPEGATVPLVASVPSILVDRLVAIASETGWNRSKAVTEAVRMFIKHFDSVSSSEEKPRRDMEIMTTIGDMVVTIMVADAFEAAQVLAAFQGYELRVKSSMPTSSAVDAKTG